MSPGTDLGLAVPCACRLAGAPGGSLGTAGGRAPAAEVPQLEERLCDEGAVFPERQRPAVFP